MGGGAVSGGGGGHPERGSGRGAGRLALALWIVPALLTAGAIVLAVLPGGGDLGTVLTVAFVIAIPCPTVGALVIAREPRNAVGWVLWAIGFFESVNIVLERWAGYDPGGHPPPGAAAAISVAIFIWMPSLALLVTFLPLLFPTGRPPSPRWRWVAWIAGAAFLLMMPLLAAESWRERYRFLAGDFSGGGGGSLPPGLVLVLTAGVGLLVLAALAALASLVVRFRRSRGVERQQLKWFVVGAAVAALCVGAAFVEAINTWVDPIPGVVALPVAIGVAMRRYRLYDVDLLINRALVYALLTALLGLVYAGGVLLAQAVAQPFTAGSDLAVATSTLAVAAFARPLRGRIQAAVDRRFYRRRYDAARTVETFRDRLREEVDLEELGADLRAVVAETVQPAHVGLWLRHAPVAGQGGDSP
jgi:hypothetical protein